VFSDAKQIYSGLSIPKSYLFRSHAWAFGLRASVAYLFVEVPCSLGFVIRHRTNIRIFPEALRANIDETESAAIITERGGQENHRERTQNGSSFCSQFA
jgi:hypothetical protein